MAKKLGEAYVELTTRGEKKVVGTVSTLKKRIMGMLGVVGAGAVGYGLLRFFRSAVKGAGDMQRSEMMLAARMKSLGDETGDTTKRLIEYASAMQKLTSYDDEQIKSAMAMLANYGMQEKAIKNTIPRILDMAAATEKLSGQEADLQQLAMLIGRAFTGNTQMLTRYGIQLSSAYFKTKDFNLVLSAMDKLFKGQAITLGKTYVGNLRRLSNEWMDFKQKIGTEALPILNKAIRAARIILGETPEPTPAPALKMDYISQTERFREELIKLEAQLKAAKDIPAEVTEVAYFPAVSKELERKRLRAAIAQRRGKLEPLQALSMRLEAAADIGYIKQQQRRAMIPGHYETRGGGQYWVPPREVQEQTKTQKQMLKVLIERLPKGLQPGMLAEGQ